MHMNEPVKTVTRWKHLSGRGISDPLVHAATELEVVSNRASTIRVTRGRTACGVHFRSSDLMFGHGLQWVAGKPANLQPRYCQRQACRQLLSE